MILLQAGIVAEQMSSIVEGGEGGDQGILNTVSNITKQRVKLNIKVLGMQLGQNQDPSAQSTPAEKQTFREHFTAPEMSIVSKLMTKVFLMINFQSKHCHKNIRHWQPLLEAKELDIEMDSDADTDDEMDDDDDYDDDPFATTVRKDDNTEHSNPQSFSWCVMRYACIIIAQQNLEKFLTMAGIELTGTIAKHALLNAPQTGASK